jgi:hypothetical protein
MILLQATPVLSPKADAVIEILLILSLATVLGWLLARLVYAGRVSTLNDRIADRQAQLDECRRRQTGAPARTPVLETPIDIEPPMALPGITGYTTPPILETFVEEAPPVAAPAPDDLKIVEGIGPKIEELLNREGIYTFAQLAEAYPDHLMRLLRAAGPRFQIQDPTTWPQQAQLAAENRWDELKELQQRLTAGRA